jgi:hypothetical protein
MKLLPPSRPFRWPIYLVAFVVLLLAGLVVVFAIQARLRHPALRAWRPVRRLAPLDCPVHRVILAA